MPRVRAKRAKSAPLLAHRGRATHRHARVTENGSLATLDAPNDASLHGTTCTQHRPTRLCSAANRQTPAPVVFSNHPTEPYIPQ